MFPSRPTSLLALLVAAGCLQPGPLPEGRKLFSGRDLGDIGFLSLDGAAWVSLNRRLAPANLPAKGAVRDLWIASCDGTQQREVVAGWSDRWPTPSANGSLFVMVDEQQVTSGGLGGGLEEHVGTLVRLDPHYQSNATFENVSNFALGAYDNRLLYRQVPPGETPGLFLWDGQDQIRLGDVANVNLFDAQIAGSGMAYFVLGSDQVLSRLDKLTDTKDDLHANVSGFTLGPNETYAALSLSTGTTTVLDLQSGNEISLALPPEHPCLFAPGFASEDLFAYQQCAIAGAPAEYHTLDLTTGADTFVVLPAPLVNLVGVVTRGDDDPSLYDEELYLDSQGHGVFFGSNDHVPRRAVPVTMLTPSISPDGKYLLYVDPQPATVAYPYDHGPLMVQDADLVNPPRQISTPGMTVDARGKSYFFINGPSTDGGVSHILVFWASVSISSADLYFANHETGELKVVAHAIGNVSVDSQRIFGTVNESAQDATGDLVVQYVEGGGGRTIAHTVNEATQWYDPVAQFVRVGYVVRGRAPSDRDGVWITTLDPPSQDGGQ